LTALRAPRWFEHYHRANELRHLMRRWVEAILAAPGFMQQQQQMNPWTGEFSTSEGYSPAMCVFKAGSFILLMWRLMFFSRGCILLSCRKDLQNNARGAAGK